MGQCHACPPGEGTVDDADLPDHLRLLHPELYGDGPQQWPDGRPVVVDETLAPEDFR